MDGKISKKILLFEDEKSLFHPLQLKLTSVGFEVVNATDGEQGLAEARKQKFDLIILDMMMPKIDGFGVLERLKAENLSVPTIVFSNLSSASDVQRAKSLGALEFFIKSNVTISEVVKYIIDKLGPNASPQ